MSENVLSISESAQSSGFKPAGMGYRLLATIVDGFILNIALLPLQLIMYGGMFMGQQENTELSMVQGLSTALYYVGIFFITPLYYNWFYKNKSSTPGKMLFNMKVLDDESGQKFQGYWRCFMREVIGKMVSGVLLGIGFIIGIFRSDKKCLHDMIAGSRVVKKIS